MFNSFLNYLIGLTFIFIAAIVIRYFYLSYKKNYKINIHIIGGIFISVILIYHAIIETFIKKWIG
jgi:hypothetical protein